MRDTMVFKTATKVPRPPKAMVPVPHSGLKSEVRDNYTRPSDVKRKEAMYCPVDPPFTLPGKYHVLPSRPPFTLPGKYHVLPSRASIHPTW